MSQKRLNYLTTLIAVGYFVVWTALGSAVFAVGTTLAKFEMQWPTLASVVPSVAGLIILMAGLLQFTPWKARHLACCREVSRDDSALPVNFQQALREGLQLGVHCGLCCVGLTAVLLVSGVMNLGTMALVGAAITVERVAPASRRIAHMMGAVMVLAGLVLIGRTVAAGWKSQHWSLSELTSLICGLLSPLLRSTQLKIVARVGYILALSLLVFCTYTSPAAPEGSNAMQAAAVRDGSHDFD